MKKLLTSLLILLFVNIAISFCVANAKGEEPVPTINITSPSRQEKTSSQTKPLTLKTTIITKKTEKDLTAEEPIEEVATTSKKEKIDVELPSDVDKILKEMDIDDVDPAEQAPANPIEKVYKPAKKNFFWIALSIIVFPVLLFALLIKAMDLAKKRFEEEKKEGPSKEELFLDEIEKAQKKTKKKYRSLGEILGYHNRDKISKKTSKNAHYENDFEREDEDFEFMVEEVLIVEAEKQEEVIAPEKPPQPEEPQQTEFIQPEEPTPSGIIDSFEISENLKFVLTQNENDINLVCQINGNETVVMKLEKAQKFNKVRKIDSKPGRDVYMVKLDSWRGLVEIKENSVKYLMDI